MAIRSKNAGDGLATPQAAEVATNSSSTPITLLDLGSAIRLVGGDPDPETERAEGDEAGTRVRVDVVGCQGGQDGRLGDAEAIEDLAV